jgi:hypothetical protein
MMTVRTPSSCRVLLGGGLAVAMVGDDGPRTPPGPGDDPADSGRELRGVGGVAPFHGVVENHAAVVVDDLDFVTELNRLPRRPLAIGRASGSCRLTRRVAPSGVVPDSRWWVCSAIVAWQ